MNKTILILTILLGCGSADAYTKADCADAGLVGYLPVLEYHACHNNNVELACDELEALKSDGDIVNELALLHADTDLIEYCEDQGYLYD